MERTAGKNRSGLLPLPGVFRPPEPAAAERFGKHFGKAGEVARGFLRDFRYDGAYARLMRTVYPGGNESRFAPWPELAGNVCPGAFCAGEIRGGNLARVAGVFRGR